jgi:hypothetical protein
MGDAYTLMKLRTQTHPRFLAKHQPPFFSMDQREHAPLQLCTPPRHRWTSASALFCSGTKHHELLRLPHNPNAKNFSEQYLGRLLVMMQGFLSTSCTTDISTKVQIQAARICSLCS